MKDKPKFKLRSKTKPWIEINRNVAGEFFWRARAANGKILADSGESYKRKAKCEHAISLLFGKRLQILDYAPRGGVP